MDAEKMSAGEVLEVLMRRAAECRSNAIVAEKRTERPSVAKGWYESEEETLAARAAVAAMAEREAALLKEHEEDQGVIAVWRGRCERAEAERDALIAENEALEAVLYLHECPSCGIEWSESECEQMIRKKSAGCICGYRQELARAEAGHG